jgi:hypothetical protein
MEFLALLLGCAVACAGQAPAAPAPSEPPVSVDRIRARLQQPTVLRQAVERQPDFRIAVTEELTPPETVLEALRRDLTGDIYSKRIVPGAGTTPPLIAVDVLQLAMALKRTLGGALRIRAERNARAEVAAALAEFCAQHDCSVLEQEPQQSHGEGVLTH